MKTKKVKTESLFKYFCLISSVITIAFVIIISGYLFYAGIPAIKEIGLTKFLTGKEWNPDENRFGVLPFILTSVLGTLGAVLIGVPLGVFCAIYISKFSPVALKKIIKPIVQLLAGIPSVVYGLVGMTLLVPSVQKFFGLSNGANLFSAIIVLSIMILPSVINISESALDSVPLDYENGSLALGANKTETVFKVILPAAKSGIVASIVLGVGRAIGEAMAVIMVSGNVANMPKLFGSVRFLTTAVSSEMAYSTGLHRKALYSVAMVLFLFVFLLNLLFSSFLKRRFK